MEKILTVDNLSISFLTSNGVFDAVKNVSFSVNQGETLGIVGESGSGKSVTAKTIMRLLASPPAIVKSGNIVLLGQDILSKTEKEMGSIRGRDIGMIFQEPMSSLNPTMRIGEQIVENIINHQKLSKDQAKKEAIELLHLVGIPNGAKRFEQYPHEFSGGMRQRVMIAIALACKPALLIADEPTTALDVTIQSQILQLMKDIQEKLGTSIIIITHDFGVVARMCDRVIVMKDGEIVESGTSIEIFDHPSHPYTKKLLHALPKLHEPKKKKEAILADPDWDDSKPLLSVQNLAKHFDLGQGNILKAVNNINFDIFRGETLGLVGESGSGKSTTGRSILRLHEPTSGAISYKGVPVQRLDKKELKQLRRHMQMIFQDPYSSLNPRFKVMDIIGAALDLHKLCKTKKERIERVEELLEIVGLEKEHAYRYPHEFSGGQRQRIGIARALAVEPDFIVCDEPLSALDVSIQDQVVGLLEDLQKKLGLTYLFIAHDLSMIKHFCDRVAVMYMGTIVELAESEELYSNPIHPYTKRLLEAIPVPDPKIESKRKPAVYDYQGKKDPYNLENSSFVEVSKDHWVMMPEVE